MKNIKVLVISHMYPRDSNPVSGIFIHRQVCHLKREECESVVIAPLPYVPRLSVFNNKWKKYKQEKNMLIDGVHVIYPRYIRLPGKVFHAPSCYTMGLGIKNTVASLVSWFKPDIIHSHTATPDGYIGLRLKKKYKLPLVVSLRGSDVNVYPYGDDLTFHLTKKVITESSKITAVSHALKKQAMKVSGARKDIDVVYTGCDLKRFCFNKEARMSVRKRLGIAEGSSVLIFVGQLQRTKGIYELIEAFKLVHDNYPELHLICVGNGIDAKPITAIIENTGIKKYVHLVGHRPPNEIPNWLSASDILVLPSWYEGLPNVVVEAMACSRPVIATCVGGVPEAVEDGKNGILIKRGDIKALAIAIEDLVGDPERCTDMGNVGRLITEKKFTWEKNAAEMAKIYYRALNEI